MITWPSLLHGCDYNPEQWLDHPEILKRDIEMMKKAEINVVSMGMFSWACLEPNEGEYQFDWLEQRINALYENGIYTFLSTPSGARPHWLARKYPDTLRVNASRVRTLYGERENHCFTSPSYRQKVAAINRALAQRFGAHPGVLLWHISNEYNGDCHCPQCQQAFREWLKRRYGTLEALNKAWNNTFWSHTYSCWEEVESPSPIGEFSVQALDLDWMRFTTYQTLDFMRAEIAAVRSAAPDAKVTTNLMYYFKELNPFAFGQDLEVVSWDSYPFWHKGEDAVLAAQVGLYHDCMRSIKREPFLLMESTTSTTNWQPVSKLKRPGMHLLSSLLAVAHGSDSVQYFQWRQSRGGFEKLHSAVVDHYGGEDTRIFTEVCQVGRALKQLRPLLGSCPQPKVALLFDWENWWALENSSGPRNEGMGYQEQLLKHYSALCRYGVDVDVVDMTADFSPYRVLIAPMAYLQRGGFSQRARDFVQQGGILVTGYWSGIADETDRCYLQGFPHGWMDVCGLRSEEIDALYEGEYNLAAPTQSSFPGLTGPYRCERLCDLLCCQSAQPILLYQHDFYAGRPALTENRFGHGFAYYIAADFEQRFYDDFYAALLARAGVPPLTPFPLPQPVFATSRRKGKESFLLLQNFSTDEAPLPLRLLEQEGWRLLYTSHPEKQPLAPYGTVVLQRQEPAQAEE